MVKAKKWAMVQKFHGFPRDSDIQLIVEQLPSVEDNQIIVEAMYLSVDPYMRPYMVALPEGSTMIGRQVARVIESKLQDYPVGTLVLGNFGWRTHTLVSKDDKNYDYQRLQECIIEAGVSPSLAIGVLGMPGVTAFCGFLRICEPQPGEVVLVNAGAGAVGSAVGQIAKIKGCKVIGYAGSDAKCDYMKKLGFDHAYNYKKVDLEETLKEAAPDGIDCFFDNVGGKFLDIVLNNYMKDRGRISLCGAISQYNQTQGEEEVRLPSFGMIRKQLRMQGYLSPKWKLEAPGAIKQLAQWIKEGKLQYDEHITEGFENMPKAFVGMLRGENIGKAIVKCTT